MFNKDVFQHTLVRFTYGFVCLISAFIFPLNSYAGPEGGIITGGTGSIDQSTLNTTINQSSQNLAIDWQSFNVDSNERVQFIQPNTSSTALNRILSNSASNIQGRIDANGQVLLVNPNGVVFGQNAIVNVGGIIASGLGINSSDFMNGNYIFNEVLGTDGTVINSGTINASLGGNVALLGKQVSNDGLISANLGSVILAAGKQSILTFDSNNLIGVTVTKEILQSELGLDAAVTNNGDIKAEGGRVLLTASTSRDVFSQSVNLNSLEQATSVVVNSDGTYTLGNGADVINTGSINVSSQFNNSNTARIVLVGENITSSGEVIADTVGGNAGDIEIHANGTTLLTGSSITSAQSLSSGKGGDIKVLGNKVGLTDSSIINASGTNGGGEVLFGGDRQGLNSYIRNADFIYLGDKTNIHTDATENGNGGKIITFANDTARIYGGLFSRGGISDGNGGFIETSGLKGFEIGKMPDVTSAHGFAGEWLIDPYDITIVAGGGATDINNATTPGDADPTAPFTSTDFDSVLGVDLITSALSGGSTVIVTASSSGDATNDGNIKLETHIDYDGSGNATLTLRAENNISTTLNRFIVDGSPNDGDQLNLNLYAKGEINIGAGTTINTQGGDFKVGDGSTYNPASFINSGTINTSGYIYNSGTVPSPVITRVDSGAIDIKTLGTTGTILINGTGSLVSDGGVVTYTSTFEGEPGFKGGDITLLSGGDITINGSISSKGSSGNFKPQDDFGQIGGAGGAVSITSNTGNILSTAEIDTRGGRGDGDSDTGSGADPGNGGVGGAIDISATQGYVTLDKLTTTGGDAQGSDDFPNTGAIPIGGAGGKVTVFSGGGTGVTLNNIINTKGGVPTKSIYGNDDPKKGVVGAGGDVDIVANSVAVLLNANGNIITGGGSVAIGDTSGPIILPSSFTNNAEIKTTGATNLAAGSITINTGGTGTIFTGKLTAKGGTTDKDILLGADGIVGQNGGFVTINGQGTINVDGVIDTSGSRGDYNDTDSNNGRNGGVGGNVIINSAASVDVTANIVTTGGQGDGDNNDDASGGNAGYIAIDFNDDFDLSANLIAKGGDRDGNSGVVGSDNTITINGDDSINIFTVDPSVTLTGSVINFYGFAEDDKFNIGSTIIGTTSEVIDGGVGNDTFTYTLNKLSTTILGGDGLDTIVGDTSNTKDNAWTISNLNSGTLVNDGVSTAFSEIENLTGNTKKDIFSFDDANNSWIDGLITGGGSADEIDITILNTNTVVQLGSDFTSNPLSDSELNIDEVEKISANSSLNNTLKGENIDSVWTISNVGDGNVKPKTDSSAENTVAFIDFYNLTGNKSIDKITFSSNGWINGLILGGVNTTTTEKDTFDLQSIGTQTVQLGTGSISDGVLNVDDFETITATTSPSPSSTLIGNSAPNTWTIDGEDRGILTPTTGAVDQNTVEFVNFKDLTGNVEIDKFVFEAGSWINGLISGGNNTVTTEADTLDIALLGATTVQLGGVTPTNINLNVDQVESITANNSVINTLNGDNVASDWLVSGVNSGVINPSSGSVDQNTVAFFEFNKLQGGTLADEFTIGSAGTIDNIDGGTTTNNTLIGRDANTTWNITGSNNGNLLLTDTPFTTYVTNFDNIQNLTGLSADDTFKFTGDFSVDGLINGGFDSAGDVVNFELITTAKTFTIDDLIGYNNIEYYVGNDTNHTLQGDDITNDWVIQQVNYLGTTDGVNDGILNGTINFVNFNTIKGGSSDDTFRFVGTSSIENIDGGATTIGDTSTYNTLVAKDKINDWNITAEDSGDLNNVSALNFDVASFSNIQNLTGNSKIDGFTYTVDGKINGLLSGGDNTTLSDLDTLDIKNLSTAITIQLGSSISTDLNVDKVEIITANNTLVNTLKGENVASDWLINQSNDGEVKPTISSDRQNTVDFNNFNNLVGGDQADIFTIGLNGDIESIIGGAIDSTDDITKAATYNTLVGRDVENYWGIDGTDTGFLSSVEVGPTYVNYVNVFSSIQNLDGAATQNDIFKFTSAGTLSGQIDGSGHTSGDSLDVSLITTAQTFTIGSLDGFVNIESITGNNSNHTLEATNGTNLWLINGSNSGTLTSGGNTLSFVDFSLLSGGSGEDTFRFDTLGSVANADAGAGTDFVDYSLQASRTIDITNTAQLYSNVTNAEGVIGNGAGFILNSGTTASTTLWTIEDVAYSLNASIGTDNNDGTADGVYFINFNSLVGNAGEDTFRFATGKTIASANAGAGTDFVDYSLQASRTIDITNATQLYNGVTNAEGVIGNDTDSTLTTGTGTSNTLWVIEDVAYTLTPSAGTDGTNDGTVNGINFINFNNLTGNAGEDTFRFATSSNITGVTDGAGGLDFVDHSLSTADVIVNLGANPFGSILNIEGVIGTTLADSTIVAENIDNTWNIGSVAYNAGTTDGENDGTVAGVTFINFNNLTGGNGDDTFVFSDGSSITGLITGGGESVSPAVGDIVDMSLVTAAVDINLESTTNGISGIERVIGSNTADSTLTGENQTNTWTVTASNRGTVTSSTGRDSVVEFIGFDNLTGNQGTDNFTINDGASLSGNIDGVASTNKNSLTILNSGATNNWTIDQSNSGTTTVGLTGRFSNIDDLTGGAVSDVFTITDIGTNTGSLSGDIDGAAGLANTLIIATDSNNTWSISGSNTGSASIGLSTGNFSNIDNLTGGNGDDLFDFTTATSSISGKISGGSESLSGFSSGVGDIVDMSSVTPSTNIDIALEGSTNGVSGIEQIIGHGTNSTLTAENQTNTWTITANDRGSVTSSTGFGGTIEFVNFNNLTGNQGQDDFTINEGVSFVGSIDGVLDLSASPTSNSLTIKRLIANSNTWTIDGVNSGTSAGLSDGFSNINIVTGGSGNDTFIVLAAGSVDKINGGTERTLDTVDLSDKANVDINISNIVAGTSIYNGIEEFVGNNLTSNITAENVDNTWTITAANSGNVARTDASGLTVFFRDFNNLTGGSGDDRFNFDAAGSINGIIAGGGQDFSNTFGDIVDMSAMTVVDVTLETTDDDAKTNLVGIERVLGNDATGATSTIKGEALATDTTWSITENNTGEVTNSTTGNADGNIDFVNFTDLTGNSLKDDFVFANSTSAISGLIDGGANSLASGDTVLMSAVDPVDVTIGQNIIRIENITGNNDGTNLTSTNSSTLRSGDALVGEIVWDITALNKGKVTYSDGVGTQEMTFIDFNHIEGGANNDDTFNVDNGKISGSIKGGTGTGTDSVDYSANGIDITIGSDLDGIQEIERVIGNGLGSTIRGLDTTIPSDAPTYTWTIDGLTDAFKDGTNDGRVVGGGEDLQFINFGNIVGGSNVDTFEISGNSTITGIINGGQGDDIVNLALTGAESGSFTFDGGLGNNDTINLNGGNSNYVATYTPDESGSGNDQFIYTNGTNSYSINYNFSTTESVKNNLAANSLTINGTSVDDSITLDTAKFKVNTSLAVDFTYSDNSNLIVDGLVGSDSINVNGNIGASSMDISFVNANITGGSNVVTANTLSFSNASAGTSSSQRLLTDITSLGVLNSGSIYISDSSNNLDIEQVNTSGIVDVYLASGNITNSSNLISSADFLANAENGNISLLGQNELSGAVTLLAANGEITFENNVNTILDDITANSLTLNIFNSNNTSQTATGVINTNSLTLNSSGDFDLGNNNQLNNITVTNSNNVIINNINQSNIVDINAVNNVDVSSNGISVRTITADSIILDAGTGAITDSNAGAVNLKANSISLSATGGIGAEVNPLNLELDGDNDLTAVNTGGGDIAISNVGDVLLRNVSNLDNNGNIFINNNGNITIDSLETMTAYTDSGTGKIDINVVNGSVFGANKANYTNQSDIRADSIIVLLDGGTIGTGTRPLSIEVPETVEVYNSSRTFIYFYGIEPLSFVGENELSNQIFDLINNLAGQQLIEVESLAQVDPAIFTDVRNYSHSDNALMMPSDQRYDETEEEKKRLIN